MKGTIRYFFIIFVLLSIPLVYLSCTKNAVPFNIVPNPQHNTPSQCEICHLDAELLKAVAEPDVPQEGSCDSNEG